MLFLTYCDSNYDTIGDVSVPIMQRYSSMHNMRFHKMQATVNPHTDAYWSKIAGVRESLEDEDWVIWCDADILISNLEFSWTAYLESYPEIDLHVSSDHRGLCLGFFIIRSCKWSRQLLDMMVNLGNLRDEKVGVYDVNNRLEQGNYSGP